VIAHDGVTGNAKGGEGIFYQGQLRRCAILGQIATEEAELGGGRACFHLTDNVIEPGTAGRFESVQVVYRDEGKITVRRRVYASEAAGPKTEGEECAGGKTEPFSTSQ
jgi:hypothetical protein